MKTILVTGSNGQLGKSLKKVVPKDFQYEVVFLSSEKLDITNLEAINSIFESNNIQYCINCAAYTAVDLAESEEEKAFSVNEIGVKNLAKACREFDAILIHISTDFVFDGLNAVPYKEDDTPNPIGVYGKSKLNGERWVQQSLEKYFIIRTSWLYSEFGNNFMKTMLRLGKEQPTLNVVNDQIGTPTYAKDLAEVILSIIDDESTKYGVYHLSNEGVSSWFDFAREIFDREKLTIQLNGIPTSAYPTPAKRPKYSVLDKSKIKEMLNVTIPHWKTSLKKALRAYHNL